LSWKDKYFTKTPNTEILHKEIRENPYKDNDPKSNIADTCFVFTTNVDNFFKRSGFKPEEICATHGTYFLWQCSGLPQVKHPFKFFDKPCTNAVWPIPDDFQFQYDPAAMLAPTGPPLVASSTPGWNTNHPTCPNCHQLQRANVYNFGDQCYIQNTYEENNLANWCHAVERIIKKERAEKGEDKGDISLVMLELGVGRRLPKIRVTFERLIESLNGKDCAIIRINPEIAAVDKGHCVIPIKANAIDALKSINQHL